MKCVTCGKKAKYVWFGVSLCEEHLKSFARKVAEAVKDRTLKAEKFYIRPCGYKLTENCVYIVCEDGTNVVISEKLMNKIVKEWEEI